MSMLLKNATLLTLFPSTFTRSDLRIHEGEIVAQGTNLRQHVGEEVVDLSGSIIMPGMVNAHTHLYSALARGMSAPSRPPKNFLEILGRVWWKLDEALDEESIYYSALVGGIEALRHGTTTLVDHHASPNWIEGSLDTIKDAMCHVGVRGILCYETTDRGGLKRRNDGLFENERFVIENINNPHFRGMIGAHASFTLNNDSLVALSELVRMHDCGVHIHVAEDAADVADVKIRKWKNVIARLKAFGLLTQKSICAHGVHLTESELNAVRDSGTWLVHNPRSNMNNAVGYAPLRWFGPHSAIGTDGFPADMFEESKLGFFRNQESSQKVGFVRIPEMLCAGQKLASTFFGKQFGSLKVGSTADLIVLAYNSPTPINSSNVLGHFLFGMNSGLVNHVMVDGEWRLWNRELVGIDEEKVMSEATKVAKKLWQRMNKKSSSRN
jgi:putative selenium metabolism protein SsnA